MAESFILRQGSVGGRCAVSAVDLGAEARLVPPGWGRAAPASLGRHGDRPSKVVREIEGSKF